MMIRQNELDAGFDLIAQHDGVVQHGRVTTFSTEVYGNVPPGTVGLVFARSGLGVNHGVRPVNAVGVIDASYTGEIVVGLTNDITDTTYTVQKGDRIAQLVYLPLSAFNPEHVSNRGSEGFGSTGT